MAPNTAPTMTDKWDTSLYYDDSIWTTLKASGLVLDSPLGTSYVSGLGAPARYVWSNVAVSTTYVRLVLNVSRSSFALPIPTLPSIASNSLQINLVAHDRAFVYINSVLTVKSFVTVGRVSVNQPVNSGKIVVALQVTPPGSIRILKGENLSQRTICR